MQPLSLFFPSQMILLLLLLPPYVPLRQKWRCPNDSQVSAQAWWGKVLLDKPGEEKNPSKYTQRRQFSSPTSLQQLRAKANAISPHSQGKYFSSANE